MTIETVNAEMTRGSLLLLGASVRALAQSSRRAGFSCRGADLFGDVDARSICPVEVVTDYSRQFSEFATRQPPGPWLYTGGLENYPSLVDEISRRRPLWGIGGQLLRDIRDPVRLHETLRQADLPTPATTRSIDTTSTAQRWLRKPIRSCAGVNIEMLQHSSFGESEGGCYYQAYVEGTPAAAVFVAQAGRARLFGVTRQIIGEAWAGASGFQYVGSVGPLALPAVRATQIAQIGTLLAKKFALRGLFGVDGVLHDDQFWVVEVNPRYTASVEILERAGRGPSIAMHAAACCDGTESLAGEMSIPPDDEPVHGKAIVYAPFDARIGDTFGQFVAANNIQGALPLVADIPRPGSIIAEGHPIATVFAAGECDEQVVQKLQQRCDKLRSHVNRGQENDGQENILASSRRA